jgi:Excalibur calcium-binding domain
MRPTLAVVVSIVLLAPAVAAGSGTARPAWTKNCTALHKRYPHGVGKLRAHDKTADTPVTNFRRSTRLYNLAMSYNRGLDRDHDGIACEQA